MGAMILNESDCPIMRHAVDKELYEGKRELFFRACLIEVSKVDTDENLVILFLDWNDARYPPREFYFPYETDRFKLFHLFNVLLLELRAKPPSSLLDESLFLADV
ncbi:hypothetical protein ACLOJK_018764 [Asimina triloba]